MPKRAADEVKFPVDMPETPMTSEESTIVAQRQEIETMREQQSLLLDRINRLETIQNQNKLRKYDTIHDPESLKKTGRIPSLDGKDPIVSIVRKGKAWIDQNGVTFDEQVITVKTHGGVERVFTLMEFVATCAGNSIPCIVNDWEELMEKLEKLNKKKHEFQRSTGKTARVNTVDLLKEIQETERTLTINVTLSEDMGKTWSGTTLDVLWQDVFNAI